MKKLLLTTITCLLIGLSNAQQLTGTVKEYDANNQSVAVVGAILHWKATSSGTVTDLNGAFSLPKSEVTDTLIIIYQTYKNDTLIIPKTQNELNIILSSAHSLATVEVSVQEGAYISIKPILTTIVTAQGLRKAACCNLSESFENTVAVDVEYADAVTGAKQISMLGLAGIYSQILLENVPFIRLLSNRLGLGFVPGSWMESISISKGVSSVINGYESISGQINVEYKKPETNREKIFLNLFGNSMGKGELNFNSRFNVGKREGTSSMFLLHTEGQFAKMDMNNDDFLDIPRNYQINAVNRWDFNVPRKYEGRSWISYMHEKRIGGQMQFDPKTNLIETLSDSIYGVTIRTNKLDLVTKNGFLLKGEHESIGTILSLTVQQDQSLFGNSNYNAKQISGYANMLYSNRLGEKKRSKITTGVSLQLDYLQESLSEYFIAAQLLSTTEILETKRKEVVPGLFAEYSYSIEDKIVIMPGMRLDYNILYNRLFWTPRIHIKWQAAKNSSFRLSAGKGYRTPNVIIENLSLLVSNRDLIFADGNDDSYQNRSLQPEEAYNAGISFVQTFHMKGGTSSFSIDYYYTHFINQTIIDMDRSTHSIYIYNLNGNFNGTKNKSYSHSFQTELILNPIKRLEIIAAYRFNDVRQTTAGKLQQKTLMSPHKGLLSLSYATKFDKWKFSTTLQYNSSMRLPNTEENPEAYRLAEKSPGFFILNAQITRKFKQWELYIGGENLLNYKQKQPILSADNPYGEFFDASIIYAPITGIMGFLGFRYTLK